MKNRYTAPFGYVYVQGALAAHPTESKIVANIFGDYIAGASYNSIAESLCAVNVEFLPGRSDWNKNRVKRILEDSRYTGVSGFPALISEGAFERVKILIAGKSAQRAIEQTVNISMPVRCLKCEVKMQRRHEPRCKCPERWYCPACGAVAGFRAGELENILSSILNRLIAQPELVTDEPVEEQEQPLNIVAMHNEISRQLEGFHFDRDKLKESIFELAALKYSRLNARKNTTKQLRAELKQLAPLSGFSPETLDRIAVEVILSAPATVQLRLKNGQIVGKDDDHECDDNPGETGVHAATSEPSAERCGLRACEHPGG